MFFKKVLIVSFAIFNVYAAEVGIDFSYPKQLLGLPSTPAFRDICKDGNIFPPRCINGNTSRLLSDCPYGLLVKAYPSDIGYKSFLANEHVLSNVFKRCIRYIKQNLKLEFEMEILTSSQRISKHNNSIDLTVDNIFLLISSQCYFAEEDNPDKFIENVILPQLNEDCLIKCIDKIDLHDELAESNRKGEEQESYQKSILVLDLKSKFIRGFFLLPIGFTSEDGNVPNSILDLSEKDIDKISFSIMEIIKRWDLTVSLNDDKKTVSMPSVETKIGPLGRLYFILKEYVPSKKKLPSELISVKIPKKLLEDALPRKVDWQSSEHAKEVDKRLKLYCEEDKKRFELASERKVVEDVSNKVSEQETQQEKSDAKSNEDAKKRDFKQKESDDNTKTITKKEDNESFLAKFIRNWISAVNTGIKYILSAFYNIFIGIPFKFFYES